MSESDLMRRVRERLDTSFDWSVEARTPTARPPRAKGDALARLPKRRVPAPAGAVGRLVPSRHEAAILRRAAGGFIMVTLRDGKEPLYCYESGERIRGEFGGNLTSREFARLAKFLVPEARDSLFEDGPPQRWNVRRL